MILSNFKKALKNAGVIDSNPYSPQGSDYFIVIKVIEDKEVIQKFREECEKLGINCKASVFENGMDIWVFKAYF